MDKFLRTQMLLGDDAMRKLNESRVIVFGIGGVGGYVVEALVRCGIGAIDIVDCDKNSITNINRQIFATTKTLGEYKVDSAKRRILEINPEIKIETYKTFFDDKTSNSFDFSKYDYVVDAIDSVKSKIELILKAKKENTKIISSMGTGNKIDPSRFEITDIYKTSVCPLARVMRYELKKRGVDKLKVIYSKETPVKPKQIDGKIIPASCSFVPSAAGLMIAGEVIRELISK